jgi:predicted MPP superfamily phosphohydrolase
VPDLILFTGDFIDSKTDHRPVLPILRRLIPNLHSRLGLYAIQGNHDPDLMLPCLADMGVHWITHRRAVLADGKARLELIGLGGYVRADLDEEFLRALGPKEAGVPRVVMCHYPDLFASARLLEPDIFLAGHTHGGQICLPGGKPLMSHDSMPKRFTAGIHRLGQTWYVVSRGMGFSGIPVRLFCPAETMELTLRAQRVE